MGIETASQIQSSVRRSSDDFSYVKTIGSLINNREFSKGYLDFESGKKTPNTYVWEVLSAIGDDVGQVIYENVLNYVDDVSNVDLCKIKPLRSMLSSFGIDYSVLNNIDLVPIEVMNLIDVLSINKKYLLNEKVLDSRLVEEIRKEAYLDKSSELSGLSGDSGISSVAGYVDDEKYQNFISSLYYNLIDGIVNTKYGSFVKYPIYATYGKNLVQDEFVESDITNDEAYQLRIRSNIESSFDEGDELDKIQSGKASIDDYSGAYRTLIEMEQERREKPYSAFQNDTRYAYYKEQKVVEYFEFLKNKFNSTNSNTKNTREYVADPNYFLMDQDNNLCILTYDSKDELYRLTKDEDVPDGTYSYDAILKKIVGELVYITQYISKLREELKLQLQKTHMKGTFNLLSYVINEYLLEFSKSNSVIKDIDSAVDMIRKRVKSDTSIIEYYDTTEYFNISTDNTVHAKNKKYANERYWEENDESTNSNSGFAFAKSEIENFYTKVLNTKNKTTDLMKFLQTIYESGANKSYIDSKTGSAVISTTPELSKQSEDMFGRYSGDKDHGDSPQMNHKNKTHASYQVHPYLFNFIEAANYNYPVINSFYNDLNEELEDEEVLAGISETIGEFGETINIAMANLYDYSGYKTRYETSTHEASNGARIQKYEVVDYDGAFYPDAVNDFLENKDAFISSLSNKDGEYYERYYQHLNLNKSEIAHVCSQLSDNYDLIKEKAESKRDKKDVWDIYKYGRDSYDNMYVLYKKYNEDDPKFKTRQNTRGQLWIRLKDHPIAFPAINGKNPQIDTRTDYYNNLFDNIIDGRILSDKDDCTYFYDMEFDSTKQYIFLAYYPIHTLNEKIPSLSSHSRAYDTYQNSSIIACKITEEYDKDAGYNRLQLNNNRTSKIEGYDNTEMMSLEKGASGGSAFLGFFKNGNNTGLVYMKKSLSCDEDDNPIYSVPDNTLQVKFTTFVKLNSIKTTDTWMNLPLDTGSLVTDNADVHVGYREDTLTFVFPVKVPSGRRFQNYIGKSQDIADVGCVDYDEASKGGLTEGSSESEMNSFDTMKECIGTLDVHIEGSRLYADGDVKLYNLNGDPSYIPSYPGSIGKTDSSKSPKYLEKYNDRQYLVFELLGRSKNIDEFISRVDPNADTSIGESVEDTIEKIRQRIYGRIYEDYLDDDKSFIIKTNNTLYSEAGETEITWEIDLSKEDPALLDRYLSALEVVLYNTGTAGKNPFYMGNITDLSGEEFADLSYMEDFEPSEVSAPGYENIYVTGTYDFYSKQFNKTDNNNIKGVGGIKARFFDGILTVKFLKNVTRKLFIPYRTVDCLILNGDDIRMFEKYHFLDEHGCITGNIDGDDPRTFGDIYLSGEHLSNYNALSDVPYLSGQDNLTFKYDESPIFNKGTMMYYYPGDNSCYPYSLRYGYGGSFLDFSNNSDIFGQDNLFIIKCDKDSLLTSFGNVEIPLLYNDTNSIRVIEDFLSDDFQEDYDVVDARIMEYAKIFENTSSDMEKVEAFEISTTLNPTDFEFELGRLWEDTFICPMKVEQTTTSDIAETVDFSSKSLETCMEKLSKFLNIYVNYKKNPDNSITLYFNYINYLNTPFLKLEDGSLKIDTISGTYLRLEPGEDGDLDIMIQVKMYYDERRLYGYKNIKLLSYHVYNVSDDKPKFLIYKTASI